jgi:hypothetical protein
VLARHDFMISVEPQHVVYAFVVYVYTKQPSLL